MLAAVVVTGLIAGTVLAGKPAGGKGGSIGVAMVTDTNANGAPNWNEVITFGFSTSNPYPVASLRCSQNGSLVYGDSHPLYTPNIWNDPGHFVLASLAWSGGSASCVAELKGTSNGRVVVLATTSFSAGA